MPQHTPRTHQKRHGQHQKRTHHFMRVYSPYLPLLMILGIGLSLTFQTPRYAKTEHGVLSYATEMSSTGLLTATNQQRTSNGVSALSINSKLNDAAQTKANDMVSRNYWSHVTPDGTQPWAFITNTGYSYSKAGENLAYGFATSSDAIIGWMNSPAHKANLLSKDYSEVGFGFANSENFNSSGQETVVVAMYATPYIPTVTNQAPAKILPKPVSTPTQKTEVLAPNQPIVHNIRVLVLDNDKKPVTGVKVTLHSIPRETTTNESGYATFDNVESGEHTATIDIKGQKREQVITVSTDAKQVEVTMTKPVPTSNTTGLSGTSKSTAPTPKTVSRADILTGGSLPWISTLYSLLAGVGLTYLIMKHSRAIHRFFVKGERYVLKHVLLDATIVSFLWLGFVISRTVGVIL